MLHKKIVGDTLNHAVLDSGCTKTVCDASWLDSYIETLSECDWKKIVQSKSETKFKFGDGKTVSSLKLVSVPAQIGKREVSIKTDATDNELQLLFSKKAMKKAETNIDFTEDKINILGQEMAIKFISSGCYSVPISKTYEALNKFDRNQSNNIFLSTDDISMKMVSEKKRITEKLHKQFGHASSNKISKLVKFGINEVEVNCPVCLKKAPLKPTVRFSLLKDFNDVIAMDFKEINGHEILHIIMPHIIVQQQ